MNPHETSEAYTLTPLQAGPPCCEPKTLIEVDGLSLRYGASHALRDVSLSISQGCITALIGPSGCGKTSLLQSLNRLTDMIPGCTLTGTIRYAGHDIHETGTDLNQLRRDIGMVFQKPSPFPLSIRRNLELPLREHGIRQQTALNTIIEQVLRDVGLWDEVKDRLNAPALALSGGQQQRLCIARALALKPKVLLMDEPCSALDPLSSAIVEDLIRSLQGRYTIVIVTHNLAQARRIANYAGFFWVGQGSGQLIEFGHSLQIFSEPRHELTAAYVNGARG